MAAARRVFAFEEALEHGETALELMDEHGADPVGRARLLERVGDLRYVASTDYERGIAALEEALEVLETRDDDARAARIHIKLGDALANYRGVMDIPRALDHLHAAQRLLGPSPAPALAGPMALGLAQAALHALDLKTVETWSSRAMEIGRVNGNEAVWSVGATYHAVWLLYRGRLDEARVEIEQAWQVADRIDHRQAGFAAAWCASSSSFLNDPRETYRVLRKELDRPRQSQAVGPRKILLIRARGALARAGDLNGAKRLLEDVVLGADTHAEYVPLALYSGDWEVAVRVFEEGIASHRRSGGSVYLGHHLVGLGHLFTVMDRTQAARAVLREAVDTAEGTVLPQELTARARLAILDAGSGHGEEAAAQLARCEDILAHGSGWRGHLGVVALARGVVAAITGQLADAERSFAEAVDVCRRFCFPWDEAETLHHWGRALLEAGDRERAVEQLDAAINIYEHMDAGQAWIEHVLADRVRAG
jgi:tetratricopeptide (TPR) repeat protein